MILEREEGSLLLDGAPTRRWVSIIAVVIPVGAFVLLAALFIRTYIVPPTYGIPNPTTTAEAPAAPAAQPRRVATETVRLGAPDQSMSAPTGNLPMLATLAVAPPSMASMAPANPEPTQRVTSTAPAPSPAPAPSAAPTASVAPAAPAAPAPSAAPVQVASVAPAPVAETTGSRRELPVPAIITPEPVAAAEDVAPVAGPVPLPRSKPHHSVAVASRSIPLPRPRPVEEAPESDLPAIDRHAIN